MKLSCEIVQDLLPLYEDGVCSQASREAVEAHLRQCESCGKLIRQTRALAEPEPPAEAPGQERAVVRSFRKVRRRWLLSLAAILMIFPLILVGILGSNQLRGRGICFTNMDDIGAGQRFLQALEDGDGYKAAQFVDFGSVYDECSVILALEPEDWGPSFVEVTIGDQVWIAEQDYAQAHLYDTSDAEQFWAWVVYNGDSGVLIPEAAWDAVIQLEPEVVWKRADGTWVVNNREFFRLETKWGVFMVESSRAELTEENLAQFVHDYTIYLISEEMYRDLESQLRQLAQDDYDRVHEDLAAADGLSRESFIAVMQQEYIQRLQFLTGCGFSLENKGYNSAWRQDGGTWVISYSLTISDGINQELVYLDLSITNGMITGIGWHYLGEHSWAETWMSELQIDFRAWNS